MIDHMMLVGLLQDTSVAAFGGLPSRTQPLHVSLPLAGYLERRGKLLPVSPPIPPSLLKYKFYLTHPSTIRTTLIQIFPALLMKQITPPPPSLAFFSVSSSHEGWSILPEVCSSHALKHSSFILQKPSNWHHSVDTWPSNFPFHSFSKGKKSGKAVTETESEPVSETESETLTVMDCLRLSHTVSVGRFNTFLNCPIKLCWAFFCNCRHAKRNIWAVSLSKKNAVQYRVPHRKKNHLVILSKILT